MENYNLLPDEVVLYKREGRLINKSEKPLASLSTNTTTELILTNLHLVFVKKTKKLFAKEQVEVEVYPIEEIKVYNEIPQIKQKDTCVEIYLTNGEKTIDLFSKHEVRKFVNKAYELLTGKSVTARGADRVKGAVNLVDDALGIHTVDTVKSVVENGVVGTIFGKSARVQAKGGGTVTEVLNITKDLIGKKTNGTGVSQAQPEDTASLDGQMEALKKLKDLLDTGIISQEEFDAKKKQILGL